MKKCLLIFCLFLVCFVHKQVFACTVFTKTSKNITLVGSNEDFKPSNSQVFIIPAKQGRYGHALFGYNGSVQSGINEKGLFWDGLRAYPYVANENITGKLDIGGNVLYKILEECATVNEVIHVFEKYHWEGFSISQLMVVDAEGESAIITHDKKGLVISRKEKNYQVCSNFRIESANVEKKPAWYNIGSGRYNKASKLCNNLDVSVNNFMSVLKETHQNNLFSKTIYSTVCNLNTGDIHICINGNFSQLVKINLYEELKKDQHSYYLSDLLSTEKNEWKDIKYCDEDFLTTNSTLLFFDKNWQVTSKSRKARFYRKTIQDSVTGDYIMRDYFMNDTLQGESHCSNLNPEVLDGKYSEYHENGRIKISGYFKHRLREGEWNYWSNTGIKEKTIYYTNGVKK